MTISAIHEIVQLYRNEDNTSIVEDEQIIEMMEAGQRPELKAGFDGSHQGLYEKGIDLRLYRIDRVGVVVGDNSGIDVWAAVGDFDEIRSVWHQVLTSPHVGRI